MAFELIYTSTPRGLVPGSYGFCVVARSRAMSERVAVVLKELSGYRRIAGATPVAYSHFVFDDGGTVLGYVFCVVKETNGDRLLAEDCMREEGDDLLAIFDRMASHGVINRELWASMNVVTTTNAVAQAEARQRSKDKSERANEAKRRKAADGTG